MLNGKRQIFNPNILNWVVTARKDELHAAVVKWSNTAALLQCETRSSANSNVQGNQAAIRRFESYLPLHFSGHKQQQ